MRFFRFRLKWLLLFVTVFAIYLGYETNQAIKQRKAFAIIQKVGGKLFYDYEVDPQDDYRHIQQGTVSPRGPSWLRNLVGDDYFRTAVVIELSRSSAGDAELGELSNLLPDVAQVWLRSTHVSDEGMSHLKNFSRLEALSLDMTSITDVGLSSVAKCTHLRDLQLTHTQVTDSGLKQLCVLRKLEKLGLSRTVVTDEGLIPILEALHNSLRWLNVQNTNVSDECVPYLVALPRLDFINVKESNMTEFGVAKIQQTFPKCALVGPFQTFGFGSSVGGSFRLPH